MEDEAPQPPQPPDGGTHNNNTNDGDPNNNNNPRKRNRTEDNDEEEMEFQRPTKRSMHQRSNDSQLPYDPQEWLPKRDPFFSQSSLPAPALEPAPAFNASQLAVTTSSLPNARSNTKNHNNTMQRFEPAPAPAPSPAVKMSLANPQTNSNNNMVDRGRPVRRFEQGGIHSTANPSTTPSFIFNDDNNNNNNRVPAPTNLNDTWNSGGIQNESSWTHNRNVQPRPFSPAVQPITVSSLRALDEQWTQPLAPPPRPSLYFGSPPTIKEQSKDDDDVAPSHFGNQDAGQPYQEAPWEEPLPPRRQGLVGRTLGRLFSRSPSQAELHAFGGELEDNVIYGDDESALSLLATSVVNSPSMFLSAVRGVRDRTARMFSPRKKEANAEELLDNSDPQDPQANDAPAPNDNLSSSPERFAAGSNSNASQFQPEAPMPPMPPIQQPHHQRRPSWTQSTRSNSPPLMSPMPEFPFGTPDHLRQQNGSSSRAGTPTSNPRPRGFPSTPIQSSSVHGTGSHGGFTTTEDHQSPQVSGNLASGNAPHSSFAREPIQQHEMTSPSLSNAHARRASSSVARPSLSAAHSDTFSTPIRENRTSQSLGPSSAASSASSMAAGQTPASSGKKRDRSEYMRKYMKEYRQKPENKKKDAERKRAERQRDREAGRPRRDRTPNTSRDRKEYMKEYRQKPENKKKDAERKRAERQRDHEAGRPRRDRPTPVRAEIHPPRNPHDPHQREQFRQQLGETIRSFATDATEAGLEAFTHQSQRQNEGMERNVRVQNETMQHTHQRQTEGTQQNVRVQNETMNEYGTSIATAAISAMQGLASAPTPPADNNLFAQVEIEEII